MNSNPAELMATSSHVLRLLWWKNISEFRFNGQGFSFYDNRSFEADDLEIIKIYRFEGMSNPADEEVIYLIRTKEGSLGYFHVGFGTYADQPEDLANFLRQIPEAGHGGQIVFEL
jgi:hypothetical protein